MLAKPTLRRKQQASTQQDKRGSMELLLEYCKDIHQWASSWEGEKADRKIGQAIVEQFKLFLLARIEKGRAKKTIKTYAGYLWALGGELIRQIHNDSKDRRLSARDLILKYIDNSGGPYWRHTHNEQDHDKYDSVCKQLFKFMTTDTD